MKTLLQQPKSIKNNAIISKQYNLIDEYKTRTTENKAWTTEKDIKTATSVIKPIENNAITAETNAKTK